MRAALPLLTAVLLGVSGRWVEVTAQTSTSPSLDQPLALAEAMSRALASNLELRISRTDTGFAQAELVGSRLRPNPSLALEYLTTGDGRVSLTQDLQLWGVRGYRIRAATLGQERARYTAADVARLSY